MILTGLILIILLGYLIVNLIDSNSSILEKLSTGFLISSGMITLFWFLLNIVGYGFDLRICLTVLILLILIFLSLNLIFKKFKYQSVSLSHHRFSKVRFLVVFVIFVAVVSSLLANLYWPVRDWDALTLYDFRGKFFASQHIISKVFEIHRYYLGYPLYTSMLHGFVYLLNENGNPLFLYTIIYSSLVVIFYILLRRITNSKIALIFTFILAFTFEIFDHSLLAYTNLPYSVFLIAGYLYFVNYREHKRGGLLILSAILIGLSGWVRSSDPFWLPPILVLIYESYRNKRFKELFVFTAIIILIRMPWALFVSEFSKNYDIKSSNNIDLIFSTSVEKYFRQIFLVIPYVWINVIRPQLSVYLLFILSLLIYVPKRSDTLLVVRMLVLINLLVIVGGIYFYSIVYEKWQVIGNSVTRMSLFMTPLILTSIAIALFKKRVNILDDEK